MGVLGRTVRGVALGVAALLGISPAVQAQAAPPDPDGVVAARDWRVEPVAGGFRVTLRLPDRLPVRAALPLLAVDGNPVGIARQSPDRRTLTLVTSDPAVRKARDVGLVWSGDVPDRAARKQPATGEADWSKAAQGRPLPVDPGAAGRYAVDTAEYNLGDQAVYLPGLKEKAELRGKVWTPRGAMGRRPLVLFLHGRHEFCYGNWPDPAPEKPWPCPKGMKALPSYRGYDAPARALASHGYLVVSISANAVNAFDFDAFDAGALARAELVLAHLDLWRRWSTTGSGPFGRRYVGRVDLRRVGLMGHSRGGEGVARAALLNAERGRRYGIRAVLPLAPTDFARPSLPGVAMSVILPYCDGDVSDLQGQHFYDDSRYAVTGDAAGRSTVLVMGANHNYFNTEWTPGQSVADSFDDWGGEPKVGPCGSATSTRLKPLEQQAVGRAYVAGFFRLELGGETALLPLLDGSNTRVASAGRAVVRVVSQAPSIRRYDLARLDRALPARAVGGRATAQVCAGVHVPMPDVRAAASASAAAECLSTDDASRFPHWTRAWFAPAAPTTSVTRLRWTGTDGVLRMDLPARHRDVRRFAALTFRAAPDPGTAVRTDLTVRVRDGRGRAVDVPVSSVSDALVKLPGRNNSGLPKLMLRSVRIPLTSLARLDLRDVRSVELRTNRVAAGAVFLSDVAFAKPWMSRSEPSRLPRLSVNDVTLVEGDTGTRSAEFTVRMSRASRVPVSVFAETSGYFTGVVGQVARRLMFAPGQTSRRFSVPIHPNTRDGFDQRFDVVLSIPQQAIVADSFGTGRVLDDDPSPTVTIGPGSGTEGEEFVVFPIRLSKASDRGVGLLGTLTSGTAVLGKDFRSPEDDGQGAPENLVYGYVSEGETEGAILVPLVDDRVAEPGERFTVTVTQVEDGVLTGPKTLTGTIIDND